MNSETNFETNIFQNKMESLPKDLIMTIALEYNLHDILFTCLMSKRMRDIICDNETFWMNKVRRDFPDTFNNLVKKEQTEKFSWKALYERRHDVDNGNVKYGLLYHESAFPLMQTNEWKNASGMEYNSMQGWSLRRDKNKLNVFYLHPSTYLSLFGPRPKEGENHPLQLIKIEYSNEMDYYAESPKPILTIIPWDATLLGEDIQYRRGDGKVSWYDDLYRYKFEFDGTRYNFSTYFLID